MNELALFAGAGGGILGGKLLGWRTVCAVEIDPYCAGVLVQRQNDGVLEAFPVWDDVCTFDGRPWRGIVDVVSGGFPCQDISVAGKGDGLDGERSGLWREFARILGEVRPRFAFVENSPALTIRGLGRVLGDLASLGYDARWGVLGADDVGAPHKRERIWIVGNSSSWDGEGDQLLLRPGQVQSGGASGSSGSGEDVADRESERRRTGRSRGFDSSGAREPEQPLQDDVADARCLSERRAARPGEEESGWTFGKFTRRSICHADGQGLAQRESQPSNNGEELATIERTDWWISEPDVGRVAHGVASRVDKLRALGNGQVPSVAALAWRMLA